MILQAFPKAVDGRLWSALTDKRFPWQGQEAFPGSQEIGRGLKCVLLCDRGRGEICTMPSSDLSLTASVLKLLQKWPACAETTRYVKVLLVLGCISSSVSSGILENPRVPNFPGSFFELQHFC